MVNRLMGKWVKGFCNGRFSKDCIASNSPTRSLRRVACSDRFTDSPSSAGKPIHPPRRASRFTDKKGVTLVELMITLVIFTIVISMIYSVFNAFIKQATSERKTAKTEMDVINVAWPLLKEIQTAGFGVPTTGTCSSTISVSSDVLTIHSTAAGNNQYAGKWGYVGTSCVLAQQIYRRERMWWC